MQIHFCFQLFLPAECFSSFGKINQMWFQKTISLQRGAIKYWGAYLVSYFLLRRVNFPVGVSLLCIAQKKDFNSIQRHVSNITAGKQVAPKDYDKLRFNFIFATYRNGKREKGIAL